MDTIASGRTGDLVLVEFEVDRQSGLVDKSAKDVIAGAPTAFLLAIRHRDNQFVVAPRQDEPLHEGDIVIAMVEESDIPKMTGRGD